MHELSNEQLKRQDFVDNKIYTLINDIASSKAPIKWNIEMIADIRDTMRYWVVEQLKVTADNEFYPYIGI